MFHSLKISLRECVERFTLTERDHMHYVATRKGFYCQTCASHLVKFDKWAMVPRSESIGSCVWCHKQGTQGNELIETYHICSKHDEEMKESALCGLVCLKCEPFQAEKCFVCRSPRYMCSC